MFIIPFKEPSEWREQITLDGDIFILEFKWNALNEFWMMNIYDGQVNPIVLGIKLVPNYPLLSQYIKDGMPRGEIVCQNIVGSTDEISRFDMNQKFQLVYYTEAEVDAV